MVQCLPLSCSSLYCILEPCFDYSRASNYFSGFFTALTSVPLVDMNHSFSAPQHVQTLLSFSCVQCSPNLACFTLCTRESTDSICSITCHYLVQLFFSALSGSFMPWASPANLWPQITQRLKSTIEMSSMQGMTPVTPLALRREGVEVLMTDLQVPTDEFSYGHSKIFIRNPRTVQIR